MSHIPKIKGFRDRRYFDGKGTEVTKEVYKMVDDLADALKSDPPANCKAVKNIYVEFVNGEPKLRVEYEE